MITISETLQYDSSLAFNEQEQEVQDYLVNKTDTAVQDEIEVEQNSPASYPRPICYRWIDKEFSYIVVKHFHYKYPATFPKAGIVDSYSYSVEIIND